MENAAKSSFNSTRQAVTLRQSIHDMENLIFGSTKLWTLAEIQMLGRIIQYREQHGWEDWEFTKPKSSLSPEQRYQQMITKTGLES